MSASGDIADAYSITLSARANNASGTVTPIAFAVLRLITSSNLVACWTGMSATLLPRNDHAGTHSQRLSSAVVCPATEDAVRR